MNNQQSIGLTHLSYKLPRHHLSLEELGESNKIETSANTLAEFGFQNCYSCESSVALDQLVIDAGVEVLESSKLNSDDFEAIFLYSGVEHTTSDLSERKRENPLNLFRYPVSRIRNDLPLDNVDAFAVSQQGCSGLLSSIYTAGRLLRTSNKNAMLCLAYDMLPPDSSREIMYNVISDATAATVVEKGSSKNKILAFHQHNQNYYWDTPKNVNEILASYFPLAERTIRRCIEKSNLGIQDIDWFVPHNINLKSWNILADMLGISMDKVWTDNISRVGHTVSCDHVINMVDMENNGILNKGDNLLLFTFGFGASWSCMILKH